MIDNVKNIVAYVVISSEKKRFLFLMLLTRGGICEESKPQV